ncbi:DUF6114 domain-containing protein [Streptomyces sp. NPDC096136]|uniref:DUF6114 domain-containing protein n=1 Tax=Streptomyces sp. NPDC096136 TaxID=3366076 RepID=UPI00381B6999
MLPPGAALRTPPGPRARLRVWRRERPFRGGLLPVPGGTELLLVPLSPPSVPVGLGPGGIAAVGIGAAPIVAAAGRRTAGGALGGAGRRGPAGARRGPGRGRRRPRGLPRPRPPRSSRHRASPWRAPPRWRRPTARAGSWSCGRRRPRCATTGCARATAAR